LAVSKRRGKPQEKNMAEQAVTQRDDLLNLALIGNTFEVEGDKYTFKEFKFHAKANPVVATRVSDGTKHRFEAAQVARAFGSRNSGVPRVTAMDLYYSRPRRTVRPLRTNAVK
jgi:hypothetical protein